MNNEFYETYLMLQEISYSNSFEEMYDLYSFNRYLLEDFTIITATNCDNSIDLYSVFKEIPDINMQLHTPFKNGNVNVINKKILNDVLHSGDGKANTEHCVSFDTQTVSYLNRYYKNKTKELPENIFIALRLLESSNVSVDYIPYVLENMVLNHINEDAVMDSIFSFETMFYKEKKTEEECLIFSENIVKNYKEKDEIYEKMFFSVYLLVYACLLKMVLIQFSGKKTMEQKIEEFCNFMQDEISVMAYPELILAKRYFEKGQSCQFFGKIQKGRSDVIVSLKNMACDLFHLRNLVNGCSYKMQNKADAFIPYFFTFDKRLIEIKDCYELKGVAINEKIHHSYPFYSNIGGILEYIKKFCTSPEINRRIKNKKNKDIKQIISSLENSLLDFM